MERDEKDTAGDAPRNAQGDSASGASPEPGDTPVGQMRARRSAGETDVGDDAGGEHRTTVDAERERRERAERFQAENPDLLERGRRTEGERLLEGQ